MDLWRVSSAATEKSDRSLWKSTQFSYLNLFWVMCYFADFNVVWFTWITLETERLLMCKQKAALSYPGLNPEGLDLY